MSNWKYTIDISDIINNELLSMNEKGLLVAAKLKNLFLDDLFEIIDCFENANTIEDFNLALKELYDWGDCEIEPYGKWPKNKQAWIKTYAH